MGKAPAFQFYAADWLADENVALMTLEEEGAYIHLLAYCWREGSIPKDLAQCSRLAKNASNECLTVVQRAFNESPTDPLRLVHTRLEREREKQEEFREQRSAAGKASAASRSKKKETAAKQPVSQEQELDRAFNERSTSVQHPCNSSSSSSSSSSDFSQGEAPAVGEDKTPETGIGPTAFDGIAFLQMWNAVAAKRSGPGGYARFTGERLSGADWKNFQTIWSQDLMESTKRGLESTPERGTGKTSAITLGSFLSFSDVRDTVLGFAAGERNGGSSMSADFERALRQAAERRKKVEAERAERERRKAVAS